MGRLTKTIVSAITKTLEVVFSPIKSFIENESDAILRVIVETPHPDTIFEQPANAPWTGLYEYYWNEWMPLLLFLWSAMIGLVIFFEATGSLFGGYQQSKLKRRAFTGLLGLLSWWWIAALSLRFVDGLTSLILPSLAEISLFETLSFTGMGVLGLVVSLSVDFTFFILIGILYVVRQVVLYLFVLLMPLLIVLWIPGIGPLAHVARFMQRLGGFYVPFLFMTIPIVLLFRLGEILGSSFGLSLTGFGAWVLALVIPIVAVLSPFLLFWQAGALFFMVERGLNHTSSRRAHSRMESLHGHGQQGAMGSRNFSRGLQGKSALKEGGQTLLDGSRSRAHASGSRLRSVGSSLRGMSTRSWRETPTTETATTRVAGELPSSTRETHVAGELPSPTAATRVAGELPPPTVEPRDIANTTRQATLEHLRPSERTNPLPAEKQNKSLGELFSTETQRQDDRPDDRS